MLFAIGGPQFPDGKGKETALKVCGSCHDASQAAALRLNREGWEGVINDMKAQGATATEAEFAEVLDYLSTQFKGEAAKQLNVNSATQIQLESVAGLLRREATAVLKYVEKTPCKTLDDLRKIPGVDYRKIEERKSYLVCAPAKKNQS